MKVAILAGGAGSRLAEETEVRPKALVEIGGKPILWHIMRHYAHYGFSDFAIALGYKGEMIKKYIVDYCSLSSNLKVKMKEGEISAENGFRPDWTIDLVDTGVSTQTAGRVRRLKDYLGEARFLLTWCDGVSNVDIRDLVCFHESHGKLATVTAVRPPARYGHMVFEEDQVVQFTEKPQTGEGWINGAFFVLEPEVMDYIDGDETQWEAEPMERLARDGQLMAYRHDSFWQCMDTLRERHILQKLWEGGRAPWKVW